MIICRTPFRISFLGGGTDYPAYYEEHGGAVLSTCINKYCYVICRYLPPFFPYKYDIRYRRREETTTIDEIQHPSARECLRFMNFTKGIEIQHNADLPAMSGLGSSSAFTVGLLNACYALKGKLVTKRQLALDAIHVEHDMIKENVGLQDQTAVAFGGFNRIEFGNTRKFLVQSIPFTPEKREYLEDHLMLFFTGFPRYASEIAAEQIKNTPSKLTELHAMKEMVDEAVSLFNGSIDHFKELGRLLDESWKLKRSLSSQITNQSIDDIYQAARDAGATGGKLLGAGGGGFMLLYVEPEFQTSVKTALKDLLFVPFAFQDLGSQIIYYAPEDTF